jgi:hypothetical protein
MVYGKEKARDMSRSLLPSTKRKGARDARGQLHREARRTARLELSRLKHEPEAFEDLPRPDGGRSPEIGYMVRRRRWADKVNPFIRWATAATRELPRESRLSHIQGMLPKGVIGEHALGHLKGAEAFRDPWEDTWRRAWLRRRPQSEWWFSGKRAWHPRFPNPEPFEATEAFLRAFKQCRGDVEATLKALEANKPAATGPERRAAPRQGAVHHRCGPAR